jgi:hypothetical protein
MAASAAAALIASGCQTFDDPTQVEPGAPPSSPAAQGDPSMTGQDSLDAMLTRSLTAAVERAARAQETLAGVKAASAPVMIPPDPAGLPPVWSRLVSLEWSGRIDHLAQTVARQVGYQLLVTGKPSVASPVTIDVDVDKVPLWRLLKTAAIQAGHRADVTIDFDTRTIEVAYPGS